MHVFHPSTQEIKSDHEIRMFLSIKAAEFKNLIKIKI